MQVKAFKTHKITSQDTSLFSLLDTYLTEFPEKGVLAVTSKIIAITEARVVDLTESEKDELIIKEAQYYMPREKNKYHVMLTIKDNILAAASGIDESNADNKYVLWPKDSQQSANEIREYLVKRFNLKECGVIITDSKTTPLRWGVTGIALAHSGFLALNNYIGTKDLFGREMHVTKVNVMDALAAASVYEMGEGTEQTPLAVITDIPHIEFQPRNPTKEELDFLHISIDDDLYGSFLKSVEWKKGGSS